MIKKLLFTSIFTIVLSLDLNAQTPSNNCSTAVGSELTVDSYYNPIPWNSTNGTDYWNGATGCNALDRDDAWGWFVATSTSTAIIYDPSIRDAILTLFEGACNTTMASVDCADDYGNGGAESILYNTTIGLTYRVRIQRYNSNASMNGTIAVYNYNDECNDALTLAVSADETCITSSTGHTGPATQSLAACAGTADDDVWYSFVATNDTHIVTATAGTLYDVVLEAYSGACGALTSLACEDINDPFFDPDEEIMNLTGLTSGNTYYVRVSSWGGNGDEGSFDICITTPELYCPTTTETPGQLYISAVSFLGTLEDTSNTSTFSTGFEDYTGLTPISRQVEGEGVNVFVESNDLARIKAWIDWDNDGNYDPITELVYDTDGTAVFTTTFGFVIPLGTSPGDYRIRIRNYYYYDYLFGLFGIDYDYNACEDFVYDGLFLEDFGEAEDYLFTVEPYCDAIITGITDGDTCGPGIVNLNATATGTPSITEYRWYTTETGGTYTATATGTWNTPSISTTTTYWVTAYNGTCESWVRTPVVAQYSPIPTLSVTPDATSRIVCGENDSLEIMAVGDIDDIYIIDEDFETGDLGVFSNVNIIDNGTIINDISDWQNRTSTHVPNEQVWYPAISSGFGPNQFVMSNSDVGPFFVENALQTTSSYDTADFTNLTLSFNSYYSHYLADGVGGANDYVAIEVSTDGTTWTAITPDIIADIGIGTKFDNRSYNLDAYVDEPTLSIRIRYYAFWSDGIAIDDFKLFGDKDITTVNWSTTPANIIDLYIDTDNDNIGDTLYTTGAYSTVYAIPNLSQLEDATYSFTINASLANNCGAASLPFTVTNNTKVWNGTDSATWNDPDNWYPNGVPTSDNCVIVTDVGGLPDPEILGPPTPPTPAYARNLTVKTNGYLELQPSTSLTVTDWINVDPSGTLDVRDSANLVQVTNVASNNNTGSINMQREVTGLTTYDYVYWSSAVENFNVSGVSPGSNAGLIFEWIPTLGGNGAGNYGEWQTTSENMIVGKGYAIRELLGTATANTAEFTGRPSNGIINRAITRGTYNGADYPGPGSTVATAIDDNWNLVGNPFPSAISADTFITMNAANITDDINPAIAGTVYLWSHQSAPSNVVTDPFYGDYVYNYNPNDYIAYNLTGSTPPGFSGFIGAGQAFFVLMDHSATSPSNLVFDNTMRNGVYSNNQFYRTDGSSTNDEDTVTEKNRIWLDLIDNDNNANSILVGYISGATNSKDKLFDGNQLVGSSTLFYSIIEDEKMSIQGRQLPFDVNDIIPLGYKIPQNGNYTIAINNVDGLFETTGQDIFLEDTYTNSIHNLRLSPYSFTSESGTFNNRFILKYNQDTLSTNGPESLNGLSILAPDGKYVKIKSTLSPIEHVTIYDLLGRIVMDKQDVNNSSELIIETKHLSSGGYITKVTLTDGKEKTQKVILRQ